MTIIGKKSTQPFDDLDDPCEINIGFFIGIRIIKPGQCNVSNLEELYKILREAP
jgi:hypothetical protein